MLAKWRLAAALFELLHDGPSAAVASVASEPAIVRSVGVRQIAPLPVRAAHVRL